MTSEILIMTPTAIALAADSVVTIGNSKTYDGANKLFMLSNNPPSGIMIYNNANFYNIPMETIIKDFRKKMRRENIGKIEDYKSKLEDYLKQIKEENQIQDIPLIELIKLFSNKLINEIKHQDENNPIEIIKNQVEVSQDIQKKFEDIFLKNENIKKIYDKQMDLIMNHLNFNPKDYKNIMGLLKKFFISKIFLEQYIGVVIAGFDKNSLFPSFISFKIITINEEVFIIEDCENEEIGEKVIFLKPFAQTDVIDNFFSGIDPMYYNQVISYFDKIITEYSNNLIKLTKSNLNIGNETSILGEINNEKENIMSNFITFLDDLKEKNSKLLIPLIASLPKDELSNLAESLINITSLKRKVQNGLETVGGEVDVALITKGDGFIWTKRKHYFRPELNPHFFDKE